MDQMFVNVEPRLLNCHPEAQRGFPPLKGGPQRIAAVGNGALDESSEAPLAEGECVHTSTNTVPSGITPERTQEAGATLFSFSSPV